MKEKLSNEVSKVDVEDALDKSGSLQSGWDMNCRHQIANQILIYGFRLLTIDGHLGLYVQQHL